MDGYKIAVSFNSNFPKQFITDRSVGYSVIMGIDKQIMNQEVVALK